MFNVVGKDWIGRGCAQHEHPSAKRSVRERCNHRSESHVAHATPRRLLVCGLQIRGRILFDSDVALSVKLTVSAVPGQTVGPLRLRQTVVVVAVAELAERARAPFRLHRLAHQPLQLAELLPLHHTVAIRVQHVELPVDDRLVRHRRCGRRVMRRPASAGSRRQLAEQRQSAVLAVEHPDQVRIEEGLVGTRTAAPRPRVRTVRRRAPRIRLLRAVGTANDGGRAVDGIAERIGAPAARVVHALDSRVAAVGATARHKLTGHGDAALQHVRARLEAFCVRRGYEACENIVINDDAPLSTYSVRQHDLTIRLNTYATYRTSYISRQTPTSARSAMLEADRVAAALGAYQVAPCRIRLAVGAANLSTFRLVAFASFRRTFRYLCVCVCARAPKWNRCDL